MNGRKLSVNKACLFLAVLLLVAMDGFSSFVWANSEYNRCLVCSIVRHLCAALRCLFYGAGSA